MTSSSAQQSRDHSGAAERDPPAHVLPQESIPVLFELLDANGLATLRRSSRLGDLAREALVAEVRASVLELLYATRFSFTHAVYVLGLNGNTYSYDTRAENHYGIPERLPAALCQMFQLAFPDALFTTIRIQKLSAATNFGGQHRTLAFSLATPRAEPPSSADVEGDLDTSSSLEECGSDGYMLFLSRSCEGGRAEVCEDIASPSWQPLLHGTTLSRWVTFPRSAWLQLHWPKQGELYAVTVTCERPGQFKQLSKKERRAMEKVGFHLPATVADEEAEEEASADHDEHRGSTGPAEGNERRPRRLRSAAAQEAARQLLGLTNPTSIEEVEDAFRNMVRTAHPDRHREESNRLAQRMQGWAVSQLTWARNVLRDSLAHGLSDDAVESGTPSSGAQGMLMLGAPQPQPQP
mmetsp:Transcript_33057/g.77308  ORF Transcript_33057/g.77308 Transcript_33057/m.77308 type:complete len:408 (+) Transcript_33057:105-1328(+)